MKTVETESGKTVAFMPECDEDLFELGRMAERLNQKVIVKINDKEKGKKITAVVISKELLIKDRIIREFVY